MLILSLAEGGIGCGGCGCAGCGCGIGGIKMGLVLDFRISAYHLRMPTLFGCRRTRDSGFSSLKPEVVVVAEVVA